MLNSIRSEFRWLLIFVFLLIYFDSKAQDLLPNLDQYKSLQKDTGNYYFKEIWISSKDINSDDAGGFIKRATAKMKLGYFKEALADVEKSLNIDSTLSYSYFLKGVIMLRNDSIYPALKSFKKAIVYNNTIAVSYSYSGDIYLMLGKIHEADSLYNRSISVDKNFYEAYFKLGNLYFMKGDKVEAENQYNKVIELNPDYYFAYLNLAVIYLYKDRTKAIKYLDRSIEINPSFAPAFYMRGYLKDRSGKTSGAFEDWNKAIELEPMNDLYRVSRGFLYIYEKQYNKGIDELILVIGKSKKNFVSDFEKSYKAQVVNDFLSQVQLYSQYADRFSNEESNQVITALCSFYLGKYKLAGNYYEKLLKNSLCPGLIYYLNGFNQEYLSKSDIAITNYNNAMRESSFPDEVYLRKGKIFFDSRNYPDAIRNLTVYLMKNDSTKLAYRIRANAYVEIQKYDSAIIDYNSFLNIDSNQLDIYFNRAYCNKTMGNFDKSIEDYVQILKYNPFDIESVGLLSECKYLKGDTLGAFNLLNQTYFSLHYLSETGFYILGSIKLFNKAYESAIEDFNSAILLNPFNIDAIIYRALAYYSVEDFVKARTDLNTAIRLNKDEITALYTRGMVNVKLGNLKEAYIDLQRADLLGHPQAKSAINKYLKSYKPESNF